MGIVDGYWSVMGFVSKSYILWDVIGVVKCYVLIKYLLFNINIIKEIIREYWE